MLRFFLKAVVAVVLTGGALGATIHQTSTLLPVEEVIESLGDEALAIFDVDDVLITCSDPAFQECNKVRFEKVCREYRKNISKEAFEHLVSKALKSREVEVIDPKIYDLLDRLFEKEIRTIALTHSATGRLGEIESLEKWRLRELERVGINFDSLSPFQKEFSLSHLIGPEGAPHVVKGVVFTAKLDKQVVLEGLYELIESKPTTILYIDDRLDNLQSVEAFCNKHHINYEGFHYTAIQARPGKHVDEKLIDLQLNILLNDGRWVSSEEAAEAFNDAD